MSASSSRLSIVPPDASRPLSDRIVDHLLSWWDTGGGRRMRHAVRGVVAASSAKLYTLIAPALARPLVAKSVEGLVTTRRWIAKAFASEVPPARPPREEIRAADATGVEPAPVPPRPTVATRSVTGEIRTPTRSVTGEIHTPTKSVTGEIRTPTRSITGEIRTPTGSATGEIRTPTARSLTKPVITPVSTTRSTTAPTTKTLASNLRCWSCLQRQRVHAPRRGGCFLCAGCNATMLVVDPIVGLTCDIAQASARGIDLNRQANETDPG